MAGQATKQTERRLTVDRYLVSPIELYLLDEQFSHFDVRSPYINKMSQALNELFTNHVIQVGILSALDISESEEFTNKQYEGATIGSTTANEANIVTATAAAAGVDLVWAITAAPTADEILTGVNLIERKFDRRFIPMGQRRVLMNSRDYQTFKQAYAAAGAYVRSNLVDSEAVRMGIGGMDDAFMFGNMLIQKSYSLDKVTASAYFTASGVQEARRGVRYGTAQTATGGMNTTNPYYSAEIAKVRMLGLTERAVCTLRFQDLATEMDYEPRRQVNFIVSKLGIAHGVLNPDEAVVIKTA
jgi:hypothetical protein